MADPKPLRLALALGDQELEQRLRPAIDVDDELIVVAHCLAADQVVQALETDAVDAVLLAWGLHRLSDSVLEQLERARAAVVLLAPPNTASTSHLRRISVLPPDTDASTVREAIKLTASGQRWRAPRLRPEPVLQQHAPPPERTPFEPQVLAIAGGSGSPGRTTVAINLAAALGAVTPTVLVDLDCTSPCVAAYLNLDPSLNVCTLAHAIRDEPRTVGYAVSQELQALHPRVKSAQVLCGLPKRELRPSVTPQVLEKLIAELRRQFRYIVLDIGSELLGMDAPAQVHRAALACADDIVLVTAADLVSLWHGRIALAQFARNLGIERDRVSMIINRHDPRYHHSAAEIEWHLGATKAALVPHDYSGLQRAMMEQRPAVLYPSSKAGRALLDIAETIHGGKLRRPLAESEPQRRRWRPTVPAAVAGVLRWSGPS